jgi:uncharacterized SAM-binding protein YcdF (DUF218 family)
MVVPKKQVSW